jgi:predicted nuclease of predicted toxin-antitoxin system
MRQVLIDENLPKTLSIGIRSIHATELGERKTDSELWAFAKREGFVLLTKDTDFFDRMVLSGPPPKVVWIRLGNMKRKELENRIYILWDQIEVLLKDFALVEVREGRIEGLKIPSG